jgi:hypothetical protein
VVGLSDVLDCFEWLDESLVKYCRDANYSESDFRLTLEDCWRAFGRAHTLGWVAATTDCENWGAQGGGVGGEGGKEEEGRQGT